MKTRLNPGPMRLAVRSVLDVRVDRSHCAIEYSAQPVAGTIEISEVENVEGRNAGLEHKPVADREWPRERRIEGLPAIPGLYFRAEPVQCFGETAPSCSIWGARKQSAIDHRQARGS